eukprot:124637_1
MRSVIPDLVKTYRSKRETFKHHPKSLANFYLREWLPRQLRPHSTPWEIQCIEQHLIRHVLEPNGYKSIMKWDGRTDFYTRYDMKMAVKKMKERLRLIYEFPATPEREYIMCPAQRHVGHTDSINVNVRHFENIWGINAYGSAIAQTVRVESDGTCCTKVNVHVTATGHLDSNVQSPNIIMVSPRLLRDNGIAEYSMVQLGRPQASLRMTEQSGAIVHIKPLDPQSWARQQDHLGATQEPTFCFFCSCSFFFSLSV